MYKNSKLQKDNAIQRKVLCTWIVELQLTKINEFKATSAPNMKANPTEDEAMQARMQMEQQKVVLTMMEKDFHQFMVDN